MDSNRTRAKHPRNNFLSKAATRKISIPRASMANPATRGSTVLPIPTHRLKATEASWAL